MITREELLKSSEYWIETIQNKVYNDLMEFIEFKKIPNNEIAEILGLTKGRVSQILSGNNLNFRLDTLVRLCLAIERIPDFRLIDVNDFVAKDRLSSDSIVFVNSESYNSPMVRVLEYRPNHHSRPFKISPEKAFEMIEMPYSGDELTDETKAS
jgi:predicted XRE-type DNA-binding protein